MIDTAYISKLLKRLPDIEQELSQPETIANQTKFRKLVTEHSSLSKLSKKSEKYISLDKTIRDNRELINDEDADPELREMAEMEIAELEEALPAAERELRFAMLKPNPDDARNAILEIRAGTGGDEAALFAADLFRMYNRYAEEHEWKTNIIDASSNEVGGYKEIVFSIEGKNVYGTIQYEMGGHRVQRVPATEAAGRIHTSAATVAVFPEAEAQDNVDIPAEDMRIDIYRSSGPGGQSVNTTDSAVRITHIPTGIMAQSQDEKSQHRNREKAMSVLKSRVLDARKREAEEKKGAARRSQIGSGDRSQRVRTYNFPQNRLTDHRINLTLYSLDRIMEGDMKDLLHALREHDMELRLKEEFAEHDAENKTDT